MQTVSDVSKSFNKAQRLAKRQTNDDEAYLRGCRLGPNSNDGPVVMEFEARGIPAGQVITFGPDQNVRTYRAWRSDGRQVRKGEKSVSCTVWLRTEKPDKKNPDKTRVVSFPKTACVFHISQTDQIGGGA